MASVIYLDDKDCEVFTSQGIGSGADPWMTVRRKPKSAGTHRVKSIPTAGTQAEAEELLKAYAARKKWRLKT